MASREENAALRRELSRRIAWVLAWCAALVALVFIPWGIYHALHGNTRGAVSALSLGVGLLLLGWLAVRSSGRPTDES